MQLSQYFAEEEFLRSETALRLGIKNEFACEEHRQNAIILCRDHLEKIRKYLDKPILINSGYRIPALNKAIGGSKNSAHMTGNAVDFHVEGIKINTLFNEIKNIYAEKIIPVMYDQLINEYGSWIHLGISKNPKGERFYIGIKSFIN